MGRTAQTIPRRLLGGELKRLRLRAGASQADAGKAVGKDQSRINKVEGGQSNLRPEELAALLDFLGATEAEREKVTAMAVEARKRHPRTRAYVDPLPDSYLRLTHLEAQASAVLTYERGIFPGLLQCPEYAEAVMLAGDGFWWAASYEERVNRVAFRLERQRLVFDADPPKQVEFIVTDDALRTAFGGPAVMRRQFEHVLRLIDARRAIRVRLLPTTLPDNPAPNGGFTLIRFEDPAPPVGFVAVAYGPSPYMSMPADTDALNRTFEWLRTSALSAAESKAMIEEALRRI